MTEHPILVTDSVSRNIRAGRQWQDRRPVKPQPEWIYDGEGTAWLDVGGSLLAPDPMILGDWGISCPFGVPGDVLWVRECFALLSHDATRELNPAKTDDGSLWYRSNEIDAYVHDCDYPSDRFRWRPSIHMPRWACRTLLLVKRTWVERVQCIKNGDAVAEGYPHPRPNTFTDPRDISGAFGLAHDWFRGLWDGIYPGSWDRNDWVWCCEFELMEG
ncbi:MAG: hypothetical protein GY851_35495 [bacterium]|nr:hypothetical protein [bacterium]